MTRARSEGIPPLNDVRRQIFAATNDGQLKPYTDWIDFGQQLKHPESLVNFVAAYGTHTAITSETTLAGRRTAADRIVNGTILPGPDGILTDDTTTPVDESADNVLPPADSADFMFGTGTWVNTGGKTVTGVDDIDLWVGGLAERTNLFGGLLGSTFNYVFENQLTDLQNGDRFYYLARTPGMNLRAQLEGNSFAELVMRNTPAHTLKADPFATADCKFEVSNLVSPATSVGSSGILISGPGSVQDDPASECDENEQLLRMGDGTWRYRCHEHRHALRHQRPGRLQRHACRPTRSGAARTTTPSGVAWATTSSRVVTAPTSPWVVRATTSSPTSPATTCPRAVPATTPSTAVPASTSSWVATGTTSPTVAPTATSTSGAPVTTSPSAARASTRSSATAGTTGKRAATSPTSSSVTAPRSSSTTTTCPVTTSSSVRAATTTTTSRVATTSVSAVPVSRRSAGAAGFDWQIGVGDPQPQDTDLAQVFVTGGVILPGVRDKFNEVEALSGGVLNDTLRGDDVVPTDVGGGGFVGCDALDAAGVARITGLNQLVTPGMLTVPGGHPHRQHRPRTSACSRATSGARATSCSAGPATTSSRAAAPTTSSTATATSTCASACAPTRPTRPPRSAPPTS